MVDGLTPALEALLHHLPSMDHVAVLVALRAEPDARHEVEDVARHIGLGRDIVERVAIDLASSTFLERAGGTFRYAPPQEMLPAIAELARMYETRPVTLVRALYDRPTGGVRIFDDVIRIRKAGAQDA